MVRRTPANKKIDRALLLGRPIDPDLPEIWPLTAVQSWGKLSTVVVIVHAL
jgi:hypothetical protein